MHLGRFEITKRDVVCLVGSLLSIGAKLYSGPEASLVLNLIVNSIAGWPTLVSAYQDPTREPKRAWQFFVVGAVAQLFTISSPLLALYALYFVLFNVIMLALLRRK